MIAFFMAWQMFLWIPSPVQKWDAGKTKAMLLCMPLIGLIIGGLWYLLYLLGIFYFDFSFIFCALLAVFPWLVTGFMHIDGFMDCADAVLCFKSHEKKLEILKDSHVGSFAAVSMVILGIFQFATALEFYENCTTKNALLLVIIPVSVRALSVYIIFNSNALETSSYVGIRDTANKIHSIIPLSYIILCFLVTFFAISKGALIALLIGLIIELFTILALKKNLGGMSGDISGAGIVIGELTSLIALSMI